jgi:hypothetical protein
MFNSNFTLASKADILKFKHMKRKLYNSNFNISCNQEYLRHNSTLLIEYLFIDCTLFSSRLLFVNNGDI